MTGPEPAPRVPPELPPRWVAPPSPFERLRARGVFLMSLAVMVAVVLAAELWLGRGDLTQDTLGAGVLMYGSLAVVLAYRGRRTGLGWRRLFGPPLTRADAPMLGIVIPLAALSIGSFWVFWLPISYVYPNVVRGALESLPAVLTPGSPLKMLGEAAIVAVAAPVVEEVLFRGVLLHRWAHRWDLRTGIVLSSILFGLLHVEPLGHFVFGVAMCALYLRTGSLWAPIAAHAINNGLVVLMVAPGILRGETPGRYTLDEFRGDWLSPALAFLFGLVTLAWFARRYLRGIRGPLPYFARHAEAQAIEPAVAGPGSGETPAGPSTGDGEPPY